MTHVLAVSRLKHYEAAVSELKKLTGEEFILITDKSDLNPNFLKNIGAETIFLPHWSFIIPEPVYKNFKCIIFHMTDLPFGRGGSPLQNLIMRGLNETKISALQCVRELDAGPIYFKKPLSLSGRAEDVYGRAAQIIKNMIAEILTTSPSPTPQSGEVTVFKRRTPEESNLSCATSSRQVYDMIRMLDAEGYPNAFIDTDDWRIEFTDASIDGDTVNARVTLSPRTQESKGTPHGQKK